MYYHSSNMSCLLCAISKTDNEDYQVQAEKKALKSGSLKCLLNHGQCQFLPTTSNRILPTKPRSIYYPLFLPLM